MKRVMKSYSTMVIALLVAFTFSFASQAAAETVKPIPGVEFKYIGNKDNQPVFLLNLANTAEDEEFQVTFRDNAGNVLYSDRFKGASINKRFVLNTDEIGTAELQVQIRAVKSNQVQVYKIGTSQNVVTDVVVNKIK